MSAGPQIDYDALAKQHGAAMDYDALAAQHGAQEVKTRGWMDSVKDFASEAWSKVSPMGAVEGINQAFYHPVDTFHALNKAQDEVAQKAEDAFKKGDYGTGVGHVLNWLLPIIGPQSDKAGEQINRGEIAKGLGGSVGLGLSLAAPELIKKIPLKVPDVASGLADRMYQSALKPPPGSYSSPEVASMVKTGIENKIPVSAEGAAKLSGLVSDLNNKIQAQIKVGSNAGATINKYAVTSRLSDTAKKFTTQVNPEADLGAIAQSGNEFLRNQPNNIPASEAQAIKSGTYAQLGNKAYGELGSAARESQKALARGIKEELQDQFPEIKGLNAKEGQLINLDEALEHAVRRTNNRDIFSLGGKIATGAGTVAGGALGGAPGAAMGAAASAVLHYYLSDPIVQSKLAITLSRATKGATTVGAARARIAAYTNALGNAVEKSSDNQGEQ